MAVPFFVFSISQTTNIQSSACVPNSEGKVPYSICEGTKSFRNSDNVQSLRRTLYLQTRHSGTAWGETDIQGEATLSKSRRAAL